jgi:hypothetical protein
VHEGELQTVTHGAVVPARTAATRATMEEESPPPGWAGLGGDGPEDLAGCGGKYKKIEAGRKKGTGQKQDRIEWAVEKSF